MNFLERFWSRVKIGAPDECWPYKGARLKAGYGHISLRRLSTTAHRVAFEIANKHELQSNEEACHSCDNPPCCNPAHLFAGTRLDNIEDSVNKGRHAHNATYGNRKLTDKQVTEIRIAITGLPVGHRWTGAFRTPIYAGLAEEYRVSLRAIQKIAWGVTWRE